MTTDIKFFKDLKELKGTWYPNFGFKYNKIVRISMGISITDNEGNVIIKVEF